MYSHVNNYALAAIRLANSTKGHIQSYRINWDISKRRQDDAFEQQQEHERKKRKD